mmetsp:Transcript_34277/g.83285  ORF Transcript_34277/g.83285 Transcript_34277/m.83285 type:complete len:84 (-) Transcript_34277:220-471(-)
MLSEQAQSCPATAISWMLSEDSSSRLCGVTGLMTGSQSSSAQPYVSSAASGRLAPILMLHMLSHRGILKYSTGFVHFLHAAKI